LRTCPARSSAAVGDVENLTNGLGSKRLHELIGGVSGSLLLLLGDAEPRAISDGLALVKAASDRHGSTL